MELGDGYGDEYGGVIHDIESHADEAKQRLYTQFADKTTWQALFDLIGQRWQAIDDIAQDLIYSFDLDLAYGFLLDIIGEHLNVKRKGWDDTFYRRILRARSRAINTRKTTRPNIENLLAVFRAFLGDETRDIQYFDAYPKAWVILLADLADAEVEIVADLREWCRPVTYDATVIGFTGLGGAFEFSDSSGTILTTGDGFSDSSGVVSGGTELAYIIGV